MALMMLSRKPPKDIGAAKKRGVGKWAIVCEEGKTAWYLLGRVQENEIRTWKIVSLLASKANIE